MKNTNITDFKNKFISITDENNESKNGMLVMNGEIIIEFSYNKKSEEMERLDGVFGSVLNKNKDFSGSELLSKVDEYMTEAVQNYERRKNNKPQR